MEEIKQFRNPFPTTDVIIEYDNGIKKGIVLIERKNPPYGLALPGGFAEYGISLADNVRKEAREETGLELIIHENEDEPFCVKSNPDRDPRAHMISVAYTAKGYGNLKAGDDAKRVYLLTHDEIKQLIQQKKIVFDHSDILNKYFARYNHQQSSQIMREKI